MAHRRSRPTAGILAERPTLSAAGTLSWVAGPKLREKSAMATEDDQLLDRVGIVAQWRPRETPAIAKLGRHESGSSVLDGDWPCRRLQDARGMRAITYESFILVRTSPSAVLSLPSAGRADLAHPTWNQSSASCTTWKRTGDLASISTGSLAALPISSEGWVWSMLLYENWRATIAARR